MLMSMRIFDTTSITVTNYNIATNISVKISLIYECMYAHYITTCKLLLTCISKSSISSSNLETMLDCPCQTLDSKEMSPFSSSPFLSSTFNIKIQMYSYNYNYSYILLLIKFSNLTIIKDANYYSSNTFSEALK